MAMQLQAAMSHKALHVWERCIYLCSPELISSETEGTMKGALDNLLLQQLIRFPSNPLEMSEKKLAFHGQNDMAISFLMNSHWANKFLVDPKYNYLNLREEKNTALLTNLVDGSPLVLSIPSFYDLGSLSPNKKRRLMDPARTDALFN